MKKNIFKLSIIFIFCFPCTKNYEIYDSKKHKESDRSSANTLLAIAGTAAAISYLSRQNYGGGGYQPKSSSFRTDYDYDWDYLPGSGKWACRGIQTGKFAETENCQFDLMDDDRWP